MEKNLQGPAASRPTLSNQPWFHHQGEEIQAFGTVRLLPHGLSRDAHLYSRQRLNQIQADTQIFHALYRSTIGRCGGRPSTNDTCCSTSTPVSRSG